MSMRTIVEFNHDYTDNIVMDRHEFIGWLRLALNSDTPEAWEQLARYGVRKAVTVHHSDERKVVTEHHEYSL